MRKSVWLVALLVLVPFVAAFAAPKMKVGVVYVTFSSPYASAMVKGYQKYAKEMNIDMTILDSQLDIQKEAANMDSIIAMRPDVIIIAPVDAEGSKAAIKKAIAAKIPVICSNVTVNDAAKLGVMAFTGPNTYSEAEVVAREAIRRDPTGRVVMITGTPGYSAAEDRKNGFIDTIMRQAPNMKILDIQSGNWMRDQAQKVMSDFITKYGDKIDIVYTHDDNMTVGAINALKDARLHGGQEADHPEHRRHGGRPAGGQGRVDRRNVPAVPLGGCAAFSASRPGHQVWQVQGPVQEFLDRHSARG